MIQFPTLEIYMQPDLKEIGAYKIKANLFPANTSKLSAPIKILVEVFTEKLSRFYSDEEESK